MQDLTPCLRVCDLLGWEIHPRNQDAQAYNTPPPARHAARRHL